MGYRDEGLMISVTAIVLILGALVAWLGSQVSCITASCTQSNVPFLLMASGVLLVIISGFSLVVVLLPRKRSG